MLFKIDVYFIFVEKNLNLIKKKTKYILSHFNNG